MLSLQEKLNTIQQEVEILLNEDNPFQVSIAAIGQIPLLPIKYIRLNIGSPSFNNNTGYIEDYLSSCWYEEYLSEDICSCRQDDIEVSIHNVFDDNQDNILYQLIFIS